MKQETATIRRKLCLICRYPIPEGSICRLCEAKKKWLEEPDYFCTSKNCQKYLPGAKAPGLCEECKKLAEKPAPKHASPPKQTIKSEKKCEKPEETKTMAHKCKKCDSIVSARIAAGTGICKKCRQKQYQAAYLEKNKQTQSAPKTGAEKLICNETGPKVTQENPHVTYEPATNTIHASPAPEKIEPETSWQAKSIAELPVSLKELQRIAHENAVAKGWHETPRSDGEMICLMHSELSEALEELRNGKAPSEVYFKDQKPEGVPIELADVVIRIFDFCGLHNINLQSAIVTKMVYNQTRPHRHGGKKL